MKRLVSILLTFMFCLILAGCGPSQKEEAKNLYEDNFGEKGKFTIISQQAATKASEFTALTEPPTNEKLQSFVDYYSTLAKQTKKLADTINSASVNEKNNNLKLAVLNKLNHHYSEYATSIKMFEAFIERDREKFDKCEAIVDQLDNKLNDINWNLENTYSLATRNIEAPYITYDGEHIFAREASQVFICVSDVEFTSDAIGSEFMNYSPMGQFAIVKVIVANEQKDAITVDSNSFELVDFKGRVYSSSPRAQIAYDIENQGNSSFLAQLNPGMINKFVYVFDVPTHFNEFTLNLRARGCFTGNKVVMPLTKINVPNK